MKPFRAARPHDPASTCANAIYINVTGPPLPNFMAKKQSQQQKQSNPAEQFSDPEMEQVKRYGQALGGAPTDFDEEVERELEKRGAYDRIRPQEASAAKMKATQTGGSPGLGPTEAEQQLAKQQQALQQQAASTGARTT